MPAVWLRESLAREEAQQDFAFGAEPSGLIGPAQGAVLLCGPFSVAHFDQHNLNDLLVVHLPSRDVAGSETLNAARDAAGAGWYISVGHTD